MDKYGREKEGALLKVKEAFSEREQELQNMIRELQSRLEDSQVEIRRLQWASQDLEKEKNLCIQKYGPLNVLFSFINSNCLTLLICLIIFYQEFSVSKEIFLMSYPFGVHNILFRLKKRGDWQPLSSGIQPLEHNKTREKKG